MDKCIRDVNRRHSKKRRLIKNSSILHDLIGIDIDDSDSEIETPITPLGTLRKKCYWIKSISFQKHVYDGFKSICYRISNIFIGSCSIFLWINGIHAFDSIAFFSQCKFCLYVLTYLCLNNQKCFIFVIQKTMKKTLITKFTRTIKRSSFSTKNNGNSFWHLNRERPGKCKGLARFPQNERSRNFTFNKWTWFILKICRNKYIMYD